MQEMLTIPKQNDLRWWRYGLAFVTVVFILAIISTLHQKDNYSVFLVSTRYKVFVASISVILLTLHAFTWRDGMSRLHLRYLEKIPRSRWLSFLLPFGVVAVYIAISVFIEEYLPIFSGFWSWLLLFSISVLLGGWLWHVSSNHPFWETLAILSMSIGVIQKILILFPAPLTYPFSLSWSETSWYYYASFFFSRRLYDARMPWPFLDIGRPLLLSVAYCFSHPPIWLIRIWEYILSLGLPFLVTWGFIRRLKLDQGRFLLPLFLWIFSWMLVGPVVYHLALSAAMVVWGYNRNHFWKSAFWIGLASLWSGILRINWVPMPAIMATGLYILETPFPRNVKIFHYLCKPFFHAFFGVAIGSVSFLVYLVLTGRADTRVGTKFLAPFLWYRLWPNATLETGILPGILLVSLGLLLAIFISWRTLRYHAWRLILLFAMLTFLFAGGLVASVRIGGGNNLHNLDGFIILLLFWGGYAITGNIPSEKAGISLHLPPLVLIIIFLTPVLWSWSPISVHTQRNVSRATQELNELKQLLEAASQNQDTPVLFIIQRHLITFGYIDTPLVTQYELEELTEMAISNNEEYLLQFSNDLASQEYALIIMDSTKPEFKSRVFSFSEEHNAWVEHILLPILSDYQPVLYLPESGIKVYAPIP